MKKPLLEEHLLNNIFFDTCVYHQPGIDLLTQVIPVKNILFASEMIGAVRGIDPRPATTTTTPSATSKPP
jgi:4-oxalmesaconate hydratase